MTNWKRHNISKGVNSPDSPCSPQRMNFGFTLIEVVLVISIIAILSSMFIPKFMETVEATRLRAAGDKIIDDIRYIQNSAVTFHDTTWFVVDTTNNRYGIYVGPDTANRAFLWDPSTNKANWINLYDDYVGVEITSVNFNGNDQFFFDWWGTPNTGGSVVLSGSRTIVIEPGTGFVYEN